MKRIRLMCPTFVALFMLMLSSCSSSSGSPPIPQTKADAQDNLKPVSLGVYQYVSAISDDEFTAFIANPVNKKFPNITMKLVRSGKGTSIDELLAAGDFPDMIWTSTTNIYDFYPNRLLYDLNPLSRQYKLNIEKFDPNAMNEIKSYGRNGELYALPFSVSYSALFYNEDIFDKFGVAYPQDGLTWDELVELAKKLSRTDGGVKYFGYAFRDAVNFGSPLSLSFVDPKTDKSALNSDGWRKVLERMVQMADSIGSKGSPYTAVGPNQFRKEKTAAMIPFHMDLIGTLAQEEAAGNKIRWDLTSYPSFPEAPGKSFRNVSINLMISSTSQHKDEAFQVISYLTDKEVQSLSVRSGGRISALLDPEIRRLYGVDVPALKGKNTAALFKATPAPSPAPSLYNKAAAGPLNQAANDVLTGKLDVATALRQADEDFNKQIESMKQSGISFDK